GHDAGGGGIYPALPAAYLVPRLGTYASLRAPRQSVPRPHSASRSSRPQPTAARPAGPRVGPRADASPHGDRYRALSALSPGPLSGDRHALSSVAPGRRAPYDRTTIMKPCTAAPLPC